MDCALLFAGLAGPLLLLGLYNYLRFDSPLESGYNLAVLTLPAFVQAREYGLFSLAHVPQRSVHDVLAGANGLSLGRCACALIPIYHAHAMGDGADLYVARHILRIPNQAERAFRAGLLAGHA